jgi:multidrug efflux system membrane fusion protein
MKSRAPLALLSILATAGCTREQPKMSMERPPAVVTVSEVATQDVPVYLDEIGKCVAREVVSIQPQVGGVITAIHFTDGADIKKGDKLFTIDPRPFKAQLDIQQAMLAQNKAQLELAKVELARSQELLLTKAGSQQDYDAKKSNVAVMEARVQSSDAEIEMAKVNVEYTEILSPIDGRAGQRLVDLGNVVAAANGMSKTPLLVIQRLDPVYADFTIAERDLPEVRRNVASGKLRVETRLDGSSEVREGELSFIDNAVQDGTGTVKLRATMPNADRLFWPGTFVRVRLVLSTMKDALLVPARAIQISQKGPFVYVVKDDSTVELRPIQQGQRQLDLMVVQDGLKGGEKVVVTGQLLLSPGAKVMVKPAPKEGEKP